MADLVVRPTLKWIRLSYTVAFVVIFVAVFAYNNYLPESKPLWPLAVLAALLLWPIRQQVRRRFTKVTITGDKLRYETGLLSKTTRTIQLAKIQDVCVRQSLTQRMMGIGNVSIETAGETSRLTIENIDQPQEFADQVLEWRSQPQKRKGEKA